MIFLMIILITILFIILFLQTNPLQSKSHATLEIGRLAHPNTPWNKVCSPSTTCLVITILQYPKQENILFHTIPSNLILKVTSLTHPSCSVTNNNHDNHNNNHKLALSWSRCGYLAPATQSSSLSIQKYTKRIATNEIGNHMTAKILHLFHLVLFCFIFQNNHG